MLGRSKSIYDYVGAGFAYPVKVDVRGNIQLSSKEANIEESINIILRTDLGERVYRTDFGSRLSELTFEPVNAETLLKTRLYAEEALAKWEPRINLKQVNAQPNREKNFIEIEVVYQIKNDPDIYSMVYPFYLQNDKQQD